MRRRGELRAKDEDFFHLCGRPETAAQLIWVRLGNCRTQQLLSAFERLWPRVRARLEAGDRVVEEGDLVWCSMKEHRCERGPEGVDQDRRRLRALPGYRR